jgi:hypothetical protein
VSVRALISPRIDFQQRVYIVSFTLRQRQPAIQPASQQPTNQTTLRAHIAHVYPGVKADGPGVGGEIYVYGGDKVQIFSRAAQTDVLATPNAEFATRSSLRRVCV